MSLSLKSRPRLFNLLNRFHLARPYSQTSLAERASLARHSKNKKCAVEIGTFMGVAAAVIAKSMSDDGVLYCVDPFDGGEALWSITRRHLSRSGVMKKIRFVRAYSKEALPQLPARADFMFIDGDHSFEGLKLDWEIVLARLAPGGTVCFHDTTTLPENAGQYCGAAEFFGLHIRNAPGFKHLETIDTLNVMQREP